MSGLEPKDLIHSTCKCNIDLYLNKLHSDKNDILEQITEVKESFEDFNKKFRELFIFFNGTLEHKGFVTIVNKHLEDSEDHKKFINKLKFALLISFILNVFKPVFTSIQKLLS